MTCEVALDDENALWNGKKCAPCVKIDPTKPVKVDGVCTTCEEAYPDRPYWDFTTCVAEVPRYPYYISGVVLIGIAFALISLLKFTQFRYGTLNKKLSPCQSAAALVAFICVGGVVALVCVIAFMDISTNSMHIALGGLGTCFVAGSCFVAVLAGLEEEDEDTHEDADRGIENREHIKTLIEKGKQDYLFQLPKEDI